MTGGAGRAAPAPPARSRPGLHGAGIPLVGNGAPSAPQAPAASRAVRAAALILCEAAQTAKRHPDFADTYQAKQDRGCARREGTAPEREWRAIELATLLRLDRGDLTGELIRWSKRQILIKTGPATFKIPDGPPQPSKLAVHLKTSSRSWPPILTAPGTPVRSPLR